MINNEITRDERVHLSENDIIANESAAASADGAAAEKRLWPQTKSDALLQDVQAQDEKPSKSLCNKIQGAIFPVIVLGIILGLVVMLFIINNSSGTADEVIIPYTCDSGCRISLVESIPENLTYPSGSVSHNSTFSAWKELIMSANRSVHIASMYWTLRNEETNTTEPSASQGEEIFQLLQDAIKRGVEVKIAVSKDFQADVETTILQKMGAEVRKVDFPALIGNGVLHTKLIISDATAFYVGSANLDWRSLTQVKEMGVHVDQCYCPVVNDMYKIFDIYWTLGVDNATIPEPWPKEMDTHYNLTNPLQVDLPANETARIFLSSSPPPLCTSSRTGDIDAILSVMEDANKFVHIAVMDYFPTTLYMEPSNTNIFWPDIDDMLKKISFENKVKVRLLASYWNHTRPEMLDYLKSLKYFGHGIDVKVFIVPASVNQSEIPYARVNHNKYMVTDRVAYIGTSNWSGDYFMNTGGVGMIFNQSDVSMETVTIRKQLADVFMRDWQSEYSHNLDGELPPLYYRP